MRFIFQFLSLVLNPSDCPLPTSDLESFRTVDWLNERRGVWFTGDATQRQKGHVSPCKRLHSLMISENSPKEKNRMACEPGRVFGGAAGF